MRTDRYKNARRADILNQLRAQGPLSVKRLAHNFGVTAATIRSDLASLSRQDSLIRTHGGALTIKSGPVLPLEQRLQKNSKEKEAIGRAAVKLVEDGDIIGLDASSTALAMIPFLKNLRNVTVVVLNIAAANKLMLIPSLRVVVAGGELRPESASLIGTQTTAFLNTMRIKTAFIGAQAISIDLGLSDVDMAEAEVKQTLMRISQQTVALADSSKWHEVGLSPFASFSDIAVFVTDSNCPRKYIKSLEPKGVHVVLAPPQTRTTLRKAGTV
jgi:DeoR/GlpR family transcriptional regulator of sugar metabolism